MFILLFRIHSLFPNRGDCVKTLFKYPFSIATSFSSWENYNHHRALALNLKAFWAKALIFNLNHDLKVVAIELNIFYSHSLQDFGIRETMYENASLGTNYYKNRDFFKYFNNIRIIINKIVPILTMIALVIAKITLILVKIATILAMIVLIIVKIAPILAKIALIIVKIVLILVKITFIIVKIAFIIVKITLILAKITPILVNIETVLTKISPV